MPAARSRAQSLRPRRSDVALADLREALSCALDATSANALEGDEAFGLCRAEVLAQGSREVGAGHPDAWDYRPHEYGDRVVASITVGWSANN